MTLVSTAEARHARFRDVPEVAGEHHNVRRRPVRLLPEIQALQVHLPVSEACKKSWRTIDTHVRMHMQLLCHCSTPPTVLLIGTRELHYCCFLGVCGRWSCVETLLCNIINIVTLYRIPTFAPFKPFKMPFLSQDESQTLHALDCCKSKREEYPIVQIDTQIHRYPRVPKTGREFSPAT